MRPRGRPPGCHGGLPGRRVPQGLQTPGHPPHLLPVDGGPPSPKAPPRPQRDPEGLKEKGPDQRRPPSPALLGKPRADFPQERGLPKGTPVVEGLASGSEEQREGWPLESPPLRLTARPGENPLEKALVLRLFLQGSPAVSEGHFHHLLKAQGLRAFPRKPRTWPTSRPPSPIPYSSLGQPLVLSRSPSYPQKLLVLA